MFETIKEFMQKTWDFMKLKLTIAFDFEAENSFSSNSAISSKSFLKLTTST